MNLTENFTLEEMTVSQEAARRGVSNTPGKEQIANLTELCANVLEPLRKACGKPIVVTSGYRSTVVNSMVGGSSTSDHCDGRAADINAPGFTPLELAQKIAELNLPYKQVIHEFKSWVHVSIPRHGDAPRREQLTAIKQGKATVYLKGLL